MTACCGREGSVERGSARRRFLERGSGMEASPRPLGIQLRAQEPAAAARAVLAERDLAGGREPVHGVRGEPEVLRGLPRRHPAVCRTVGDEFAQVWSESFGEDSTRIRVEFGDERLGTWAHTPTPAFTVVVDDGRGPGRYSTMHPWMRSEMSMTCCLRQQREPGVFEREFAPGSGKPDRERECTRGMVCPSGDASITLPRGVSTLHRRDAPRMNRSNPAAFSADGASRARTGDLLLAKQALSQLSYGPVGHECTSAPGLGGHVPGRPPSRLRTSGPGMARSRSQPRGTDPMANIEKSIEVDVPVRTAYNQWTQFEEFPQLHGGGRGGPPARRHAPALGGGDRRQRRRSGTPRSPSRPRRARRLDEHAGGRERRRRHLPPHRRRRARGSCSSSTTSPRASSRRSATRSASSTAASRATWSASRSSSRRAAPRPAPGAARSNVQVAEGGAVPPAAVELVQAAAVAAQEHRRARPAVDLAAAEVRVDDVVARRP